MSKRIPVSAAKFIADKYEWRQVIVLAWDGESGTTHITTYGTTMADCKMAAEGGRLIAERLELRPK